MELKNRVMPFYQAIPKLLTFQVVSFVLLSLLTWGVSALCGLLLGLTGKAVGTQTDRDHSPKSFLFDSVGGTTEWQRKI